MGKVELSKEILKSEVFCETELDFKKLESIWNKIKSKEEFRSEVNRIKFYFPNVDADNNFGGSIFDEMKFSSKEEIAKLNENKKADSPMAKLLKAMAWKNADLGKENIILEGLVNKNDGEVEDENQRVFFQFGRFLRTYSLKEDFSEVEPIVDQHTLRAYRYINSVNQAENWNKYREWYKSTVKKCGKSKNAFWLLNHIMFVLGKAIKE